MEGTQTMTTNPTPLQERIARALMTHECDQHEDQDECMTCDSSMVTCSHPPFMYCVEHDTTVDVGESCPVALERAAAVLPIVAVEVRKAKAEALREAAEELSARSKNVSSGHAQIGVEAATDWIRRRSDIIETGDSDEHR